MVNTNITNDAISDGDLSADAQKVLTDNQRDFPIMMDNAALFLFIGLWAVVIILSFLIDTYPVFFWISFILLVLVLIVAGYLANAADEIFSDSSLNAYYMDFPKSAWLINHFVLVALVVTISILIAMYAKYRNG